MLNFMKQLKFNDKGLIPAIIQDCKTEKIFTLCYMTKKALQKTLKEKKVYLFRRSKNRLMMKGETSGHIQLVREVFLDCEGKSILLKVEQRVAACHLGYFTCYFRRLNEDGTLSVVEEKIFDPKEVY